MQVHQVRFLAVAELGLLAAQPRLGAGDLRALAVTHPDQVDLELRDHRQHVEEQPPDRIGRVVYAAAEADLTSRRASSSAMSRASGSDRASRSS
jgi:hypothetical protein